jgi:hypothetical protein
LNARVTRAERLALAKGVTSQAVLANTSAEQDGEATKDQDEGEPTHEDDGYQKQEDDGAFLPYPEQREREYFGMYFAELDDAMADQGHDAGLTRELSEAIAPEVADGSLGKLVSASCSTRICRVEVEETDDEKRANFLMSIMRGGGRLLQRATIHIPTDEGRIVGYFSKRGTVLPRPSVSFGAHVEGHEQ